MKTSLNTAAKVGPIRLNGLGTMFVFGFSKKHKTTETSEDKIISAEK